jgi:hypothetical protein
MGPADGPDACAGRRAANGETTSSQRRQFPNPVFVSSGDAAMIPPEETETGDVFWSSARAIVSGRLRNGACSRRRAVCAIVVAMLSASSLVVQAQEKPLEIGVLALGPRKLPVWQCGSGGPQLAAAPPHHETVPFYVRGLLDELEKLKYVENRPENAGKPGRRFVLDLRMGTLPEIRGFAREFVRKRVDVIVAVAAATVRYS